MEQLQCYKILSLQEYCGDILNFKTYSKSYKNKKRIENDRENWVIFQDVHEPIIERAVFEQVQQKRGKIRKRRTHEGERNMFPACWSALIADTTCTFIQSGQPRHQVFQLLQLQGQPWELHFHPLCSRGLPGAGGAGRDPAADQVCQSV